jgi:hypothetical protein
VDGDHPRGGPGLRAGVWRRRAIPFEQEIRRLSERIEAGAPPAPAGPRTPPACAPLQRRDRAREGGLLRIEATSTNANAILDVYLTVRDSYMFTLTNNGGGRYLDQRGWVTNPGHITVKSNFGGSATATVSS